MQINMLYTFPLLSLVAGLTLSGCFRESQPPKATYTVDEYLAKPDVMAAKLRECTNNPGELRNNPDCINVKEAVKRQGIGSYSKLPPLEFKQPGTDTSDAKTSQK